MRLRTVSPQWFHEDRSKTAKCTLFPATRDYDPWFNESEEEDAVDETEDAKKICTGADDGNPCPLLSSCLEFAMSNNERWGVWGGLAPDERADLRKIRKLIKHGIE